MYTYINLYRTNNYMFIKRINTIAVIYQNPFTHKRIK